MKIKVKCDYCGKECRYWGKLRRKNNLHYFCSRKCYSKYRISLRKKIKCDYCSKIIFIKPCLFKKNKNHFCCVKCFGKYKIKNSTKIIKCDYCNKKINQYKYRLNKNNHHFCSQQCFGKFRSNILRIKIKCSCCKKILYLTKFYIRSHKYYFCGQQCRNRWRMKKKIKIKCDCCGRIILKSKSKLNIYKHHFCDMKCRVQYQIKNSTKIVKCAFCAKKCIKHKLQIQKNKNTFCNRKCASDFKTFSQTRKGHCDNCKKVITKIIAYDDKYFDHHFCCQECRDKYRLKHGGTKRIKCEWCNKSFFRVKSRIKRSRYLFCSQECHSQWLRGENHHNWLGGISFDSYGDEFNNKLKDFIRKRDSYICQNPDCGVPEKECLRNLSIHHIDYNKKNNDTINLIAVCLSCNAKANKNRNYWKVFYENIQIKRKVHLLERNVN